MTTQAQDDIWYESDTGNHQGLVISEKTGANIAVTYDKKHAKLIAAAPELLKALLLVAHDEKARFSTVYNGLPLREVISRAIAKAKGQP